MAPPTASRQVFGQTMRKKNEGNRGGGASRYQRQFGGGKNSGAVMSSRTSDADEASKALRRRQKQAKGEAIDEAFGMEKFTVSASSTAGKAMQGRRQRRGWLYNMMATTVRCVMSMS